MKHKTLKTKCLRLPLFFGICVLFISTVLSVPFHVRAAQPENIQAASVLSISEEKVVLVDPTTVQISWQTNAPATSRVAYGTESRSAFNTFTIDSPDTLGYASSTDLYWELTTKHTVTIANLTDLHERSYFFRPYSAADHETRVRTVGREIAFTFNAATTTAQSAVDTATTTNPVLATTTDTVSVHATTTDSAANTTCPTWISGYIRSGQENDPSDVRNLQIFLNSFEGNNLEVTSVYDAPTVEAVKNFQVKYSDDVLAPWQITQPTGFVYVTTRQKINERFCGPDATFPLTAPEEQIIRDNLISRGLIDGVLSGVPGTETGTGTQTTDGGGIADGISLDGEPDGVGTTTPDGIDAGTSTVTPGTFLNGLIDGVPDVEVPIVLAILAAILLGTGGYILLRSFRNRPDETVWTGTSGGTTTDNSVLLAPPASTGSEKQQTTTTEQQAQKTTTTENTNRPPSHTDRNRSS